MTIQKQNHTTIVLTIAIIMFMITVMPIFHSLTYAASIPKLDEIRVALYIDVRGTVPSVTLSSANPLSIGIREAVGITQWLEAPANEPISFSMNNYMLKVLDTSDYSAAVSTYSKIASLGNSYLFKSSSKGQTVYQVRLGGFRTADEALAARQKIPADATPDRNKLVATGPLFASIGTYDTEAAATNHQMAMARKGVTTDIAIHENSSGKIVYSVWLGDATSEQQLENVKAAAIKAMPGLIFQPVDDTLPYLLKRYTISTKSASEPAITHYLYNALDQKVWVHAGEGVVKVHERYGRSYRGSMEISSYNGKLALINQVSFEQYLYGVVSSELGASWPLEALKAQAVAARTYALKQGMKYKIAHISDTTFDQAYMGKDREFAQAIEAVEGTRGEVIMDKDGLIIPFYSSNSGGVTAEVLEAWSNPVAYVKSVPSPDEDAQKDKPVWYRIMLDDGRTAYISSDYAILTEDKNPAGLPYIEVTGMGVNIRLAPRVDETENAPIAKVNAGERYVWIGQDVQSNAYNWIRGPYSADVLKASINSRASTDILGSLQTLEVTQRGVSDRVIGMIANGQKIDLTNADAFRGAMNGLPSTRFDVEETGRYTILGAKGKIRELPVASGAIHIQSGDQSNELSLPEYYVMNADQQVRAVTKEPKFRFVGLGFGHGIGMSQYGTKALAELGYDYVRILQYYYKDVSIMKE
ncbi:MAG: SpoIID/LytB domain-containing protein [Paenibacillaceae bacterium]